MICLRLGERTTSKGLIATAFGEPAPFDLDPPDPAHPELAALLVPLSRKQFDLHAERVRKLASRRPKTEADAAWLRNVCQAIMAGFIFGPHFKEAAKKAALGKAIAAGEEPWAKQALLPWIENMPTAADQMADLDSITRIIADLLSQPL